MPNEYRTLLAGAAESDITPPVGTELAGYFQRRVSDGVIHPLMAKAAVFGEGESRCCLIVCDIITMTAMVRDRTRRIISDETGIRPERIMMCATHTHTGPEIRNGSKVTRVNAEYREGLPRRIADAAIKAASNMKPAHLCIGVEHEEGLAFNRRFRMSDGSEQFGPHPDGDVHYEDFAGPTDPAFGALVFKETFESKPFLVICNYSVHIDVTSGTKISADFPAVMTKTLRAVYGPELMVMYVQGACGNINHVPYLQDLPYPVSGVWKSEQMGRAFAGKAMSIIEKAKPSATVKVDTVSEILDVPKFPKTDPVYQSRLAASKAKKEPNAFDKALIERSADYDDTGTIPREVQTMRIGDAAFCGAPGEYFVEWGLEIKKWSPFRFTFIAELCDDSVGYIPTYEAFMRGGYEATPVVSVRSTPALGQMIADTNFRNLRRLKD
ncbi:MAG: neutral/alkaline non-lysosomal ceramidase N-terminal domain-containing protein [Victivallales bacterium]|nr:neutral/alkaline non-lysosomal ceramidase N-terminal domain-containing protein [Victivallales bacterium]